MNSPKLKKRRTGTARARKKTGSPQVGTDKARLASIIASQLTEEIVTSNLPVGAHVGTEAELMKRFGVSREPLREAIRILEWQGLVAASRGRRGGGLRVLSPGIDAVSGMLRTYLQLSDISMGEVLECMGILHEYLFVQVVMRATRTQIKKMRQMVANARAEFEKGSTNVHLNVEISDEILSAAPNSVGRLFQHALSETSVDFAHAGRLPRPTPGANLGTIKYFETVINAIENRDVKTALKTHFTILRDSAENLSALERRNSKVWNTHSFLMGDYTEALLHISGRQKRAAGIAYKIAAYIRRNNLTPGTQISLQSADIDEHGASRAVLREAIRLLEFFGVIKVRRGNEGGLYAIAPDPAHILMFAQIYFRQMEVDPKQLTELREHLGTVAVNLCAAKLSTAGLLAIRNSAEQLSHDIDASAASKIAREIGRLIFSYSGNRALLLFGEVLFYSGRPHSDKSIDKIYRPVQVGERCAETVAQLSTAFLKSNEAEMIDALNALRRIISALT